MRHKLLRLASADVQEPHFACMHDTTPFRSAVLASVSAVVGAAISTLFCSLEKAANFSETLGSDGVNIQVRLTGQHAGEQRRL